MLQSLRTQYLIDLIRPYTRLELSFLAKQLNVDKAEVEELLIGLILEGKVEGRIDQVNMRLELAKGYVTSQSSLSSSERSFNRQSLERKRYAERWG
jgi:COP9 signalosome complex subunit 2